MSAEYFLGSSEWAAARLRLQHELTKTNFDGHLLDPRIPPLAPGMRIADVACGTGVWLLDVLDAAPPGVQGEGLDVTLNGVPPAAWLPADVAFRELDILAPLPAELQGRYDVVHAQFASSFVRDPHAATFLGALRRILKPGGYLQLTDSEAARWSWKTGTSSGDAAAAPEMAALYGLIGDIFGGFRQWTWLDDIAETLRGAGFDNVGPVRRPRAKASTLQPSMTNIMLAQAEAGEVLARHPTLGARAAEQKAQRERATEEAARLGTGLDMALVRCCARKPT